MMEAISGSVWNCLNNLSDVVTLSATTVFFKRSSRPAGWWCIGIHILGNTVIHQTPSRCPKCNFTLDSADQIFPNFLFNELVSKYKNSLESQLTTSNLLSHPDLSAFKHALASNFDSMSLPDVDLMLKLLETKKQQLAANSVLTQKQLLKVL